MSQQAIPIEPSLFLAVVISRGILGFLGVWFYLRGGIALIWWWTFLLQTGHLPGLTAHS